MISRLEQETIILFNESEPTASVYTFNGKLQRKLSELHASRPDDVRRITEGADGAVTFEVPKRWIKVNAGPLLSSDQKARLAEVARARFASKL